MPSQLHQLKQIEATAAFLPNSSLAWSALAARLSALLIAMATTVSCFRPTCSKALRMASNGDREDRILGVRELPDIGMSAIHYQRHVRTLRPPFQPGTGTPLRQSRR
jgi:hypothetical protein